MIKRSSLGDKENQHERVDHARDLGHGVLAGLHPHEHDLDSGTWW